MSSSSHFESSSSLAAHRQPCAIPLLRFTRHPWLWLPCRLPSLPHTTISSHDKIETTPLKDNNPTSLFLPSEPPSPGPLNQTFASGISGSRFTATISPDDLKSFTTDNQQSWLTQSPPPRLISPVRPQNYQSTDQDSDFVLFPPASVPQVARRITELAPATSPITPNRRRVSASPGQLQQLLLRRNSTQQYSSGSPVQNQRVRNIIQATGPNVSSTSSPRYSPTGQYQQQRFYASSAPNSSAVLQQQASPRTRPPVPLFSHSKSSNGQHPTMFDSSFSEDMPSDSAFDWTSGFIDTSAMSSDSILQDTFDFIDYSAPSAFEPNNSPAPAQSSPNVQTISPRELFMDPMSAPPSTAFTNLSTPGTSTWDSPYQVHSTDTSPLMTEDMLDPESDNWPSLFASDGPTVSPITSSVAKESPDVTMRAPSMSRNSSTASQASPTQSARGSNQGRRQSSFAGVRKREKPLPPITVEDPTDIVAVKRARNTAAARKSRQKRVENTEKMMDTITEMQAQIDYWKGIAVGLGAQE